MSLSTHYLVNPHLIVDHYYFILEMWKQVLGCYQFAGAAITKSADCVAYTIEMCFLPVLEFPIIEKCPVCQGVRTVSLYLGGLSSEKWTPTESSPLTLLSSGSGDLPVSKTGQTGVLADQGVPGHA